MAPAAVFAFGLGDQVKDHITSFTGIITSRSENINGCARYWVQPQELKDGKMVEGCWMDEPSLILLRAQLIKPVPTRTILPEEPVIGLVKTGGPTDQPAARTGPAGR